MKTKLDEHGLTLTELLIVIAIIGILAAIAFPSYTSSVVKTKRRAAQACLSNYATYMERYYTTNLRYCNNAACDAATLPSTDCASASNTGQDYSYSVIAASSTYTVSATPSGSQAARDTRCGTLTITQTGAKAASGVDAAACW